MRTKVAIAQGTLGRRILVERTKLHGMQQNGEFRGLSYQHGLVIGLLVAKEIMATLTNDGEEAQVDAIALLKEKKAAWEDAQLTQATQVIVYGDGKFRHAAWQGFPGAGKDEMILRLVKPGDPEPVGLDQ